MSEEEKKAIDILQNCIADYVIGEYCEKCGDRLVCNDRNEDCYFQQAIDTVVNLIEKQEKEIYRLQNIKRKDIQDLINNEHVNIYKNYINKDKIRDLLKKLKDKEQELTDEQGYWGGSELQTKIEILEELLEVNNE